MFLSLPPTLQAFPSAPHPLSPQPTRTPTHPTHPFPHLLDTQLAMGTACCSLLRTPFLPAHRQWGTATTKQCWCLAAFTSHPHQMTPIQTIWSTPLLSLLSHHSRHFSLRACHLSLQCYPSGPSMGLPVRHCPPWAKLRSTLVCLLQSRERTMPQPNSCTFPYQVRHHMSMGLMFEEYLAWCM